MELDYKQQLIKIITQLSEEVAGKVEITIAKEGDQWRVNVISQDDETLVGEKGENIKAIQHIARVIMHRQYPNDRTHFMIDVGEFRKNREKLIKSKISLLAQKEVIDEGTTLILRHFNGYERKLVHNILADTDGLETISIGEDESRKLIIRPTSEVGSKGIEQSRILDIKDLDGLEFEDYIV
jgi:spoIIIJ-associated protein